MEKLDNKSLMSGDWVHIYKENMCYDADYRITGIEEKYIWCGQEYFSIDDVQPIPLTPEILEKNGFTKEYGAAWNIYRFSAPWFVLYKKEFGFMLDVGSYEIPIKYVHELQHALRLCRIDKEIKL